MEKNITRRKLGIAAVLAFLFICIVFIIVSVLSGKHIEGISRYEWIQMLSERFGMCEYSGNSAYFDDVGADSPYFESVQSSYEWGVLDTDTVFKGEDIANGEFIALSAMKAIGKYKIQIYLGLERQPSDKEYLKLALDKGVIDKSLLNKSIDSNEALKILERAEELALGELWVNDYVVLQYQDDVMEIEEDDALWISDDCSQMVISDDVLNVLSVDSKVVFLDTKTGAKLAKKISDIDGYTISLTDVENDEVIHSLVLSDVERVTADDIISFYGLNEDNLYYEINEMKYTTSNMVKTGFSYDRNSGGFSVTLQQKDSKLRAVITNHDSGLSYTLPLHEKIKGDIDVKLDVTGIDFGLQMVGMEYANIQMEADMTWSGEVSVEQEAKIPLCEGIIYFGNSLAGINVNIYLVFSLDGSISIQAETPMQIALNYEKNAGIRLQGNVNTGNEPVLAADCEAQVKLQIQPVVKLLTKPLIDVEADVGVSAKAEVVERDSSEIDMCMDLSFAMPIFTVSVSGDDDISTALGRLGVSGQWDIMMAENALYHKECHGERYRDMTFEFVEECTYKQQENEFIPPLDSNHLWYACFNSELIDKGDYYEIRGKLLEPAFIPVNTIENMSVGDVYSCNGIDFIYTEKLVRKKFGTDYLLTDRLGNEYIVYTSSWSIIGESERLYSISIQEAFNAMVLMLVEEDYVFHIAKRVTVDYVENVGINTLLRLNGKTLWISCNDNNYIVEIQDVSDMLESSYYIDTTGAVRNISEINN